MAIIAEEIQTLLNDGDLFSAKPYQDELELLKADEVLRHHQHRKNFEQLKQRYTDLRQQLADSEQLVATHRQKLQAAQEHCQQLEKQSGRDREAHQKLEKELKAQIITPEQLELQRQQVRDEVRVRHGQQLTQVEDEADQLRHQLYELRFQLSSCRAELEHHQQLMARQLSEQQLKLEARVAELTAECQQLRTARVAEQREAGIQLLPTQRENMTLALRLKATVEQLETARAERQAEREQARVEHHDHQRRLEQLNGQLREVEQERSRLHQLNQTLQLQTRQHSSELADVRLKLHRQEISNVQLSTQLQDQQQQHQRHAADLQLELEQLAGAGERERAGLEQRCRELEQQLGSCNQQTSELRSQAAEVDRRTERRVVEVRQHERDEQRALRAKLLELESSLLAVEQERDSVAREAVHTRSQHERRMTETREAIEQAERELETLHRRIKEHEDANVELDQEKNITSRLRRELHTEQTRSANLTQQLAQSERQGLDRVRSERESAVRQARCKWHEERRRLLEVAEDTAQHSRELQQQLFTAEQLVARLRQQQLRHKQGRSRRDQHSTVIPEKTTTQTDYQQLQEKYDRLLANHNEFTALISAFPTGDGVLQQTEHKPPASCEDDARRLTRQLQQRLGALDVEEDASSTLEITNPDSEHVVKDDSTISSSEGFT